MRPSNELNQSVKTRLRIGKICYVNSYPFYHGIVPQDAGAQKSFPFEVDFYENYPSKINLAMRKGQIDMAPISSLEYLNHPNLYTLLPDIAIGARDFSGSVLLISKEKIEGLNGADIVLTRQSMSSAMLLRVLLKFKYKYENRFISSNEAPDKLLEKYQAALIIGDSALFYQPAEFVYKYDLSELWWNWTGKPFCFALWAVRKDFAERNKQVVLAFYHRLRKNTENNLADIEKLLVETMQISFLDERFPKIFGYLFNLNYGLDLSMRDGLELYYRMAHRLHVSPRPQKLDFFDVK